MSERRRAPSAGQRESPFRDPSRDPLKDQNGIVDLKGLPKWPWIGGGGGVGGEKYSLRWNPRHPHRPSAEEAPSGEEDSGSGSGSGSGSQILAPSTFIPGLGWVGFFWGRGSSTARSLCGAASIRAAASHRPSIAPPPPATTLRYRCAHQTTEPVLTARPSNHERHRQTGKVIGGTRGNAILDYVSGAPGKESIVEDAPGALDYDELIKYGFAHIVTPIMDMEGGRMEAYRMMGLTPPPLPKRAGPKSAPKFNIDRTGEGDPGRYSGLKMGQVLDDDEMGRRLAEVQERSKKGERLRPRLEEEDYVQPFADKRNTGPRQVPDWTPEKIDEAAKRQSEALIWARKAKEGEFKRDLDEALSVEGGLRTYCITVAVFCSFAFGRSTIPALTSGPFGMSSDAAGGLVDTLQIPGIALIAAAIGSAAVCSVVLAPGKNRGAFVWAIKGLAGGPVAVVQLRGLDTLMTRGEATEAEAVGKKEVSDVTMD